jgi:hypothetical protein
MSQSNERPCHWKDCENKASKHVTYNYQPGEIEFVSDRGAKIPFLLHHANLCDTHVSELGKLYSDVNEVELGRCTSNCPIA